MADMRNAFMVFVAVATLGAYVWRSARASVKYYSDWLIGNVEAEMWRNPQRVYLVALGLLGGLVVAVVLL